MIRASLLLALLAAAPAEAKVAVGKLAPDFQLRRRDQTLVRLSSLARRQVVVLDFFRTDCAPCRKSLPELVKLQRRFPRKIKVVLVALLEEEEGERKLTRYLARAKLPFPVLIDSYGSVAKKYIASKGGRSIRLPCLFVIDRKRKIRARHHALLSDSAPLSRLINRLR